MNRQDNRRTPRLSRYRKACKDCTDYKTSERKERTENKRLLFPSWQLHHFAKRWLREFHQQTPPRRRIRKQSTKLGHANRYERNSLSRSCNRQRLGKRALRSARTWLLFSSLHNLPTIAGLQIEENAAANIACKKEKNLHFAQHRSFGDIVCGKTALLQAHTAYIVILIQAAKLAICFNGVFPSFYVF